MLFIDTLSPECANINFAVPSIQTLSTFNIGKFNIPRKLDPGVITTILKSLGNSDENVYKFCADANKVTAGVDRNGGDIDMFGCDSGTPLLQKQAVYEKVKSTLEFLIKLVSQNDNHIRHRDLHNKDGSSYYNSNEILYSHFLMSDARVSIITIETTIWTGTFL